MIEFTPNLLMKYFTIDEVTYIANKSFQKDMRNMISGSNEYSKEKQEEIKSIIEGPIYKDIIETIYILAFHRAIFDFMDRATMIYDEVQKRKLKPKPKGNYH